MKQNNIIEEIDVKIREVVFKKDSVEKNIFGDFSKHARDIKIAEYEGIIQGMESIKAMIQMRSEIEVEND